MDSQKLTIGIGVLGLVAAVGVGGYLMGTKSTAVKTEAAPSYSSQEGSPSAAPQSANYSGIINDLKAKLNENPNDFDANVRLGDAYFEMKNFNEAVAFYKKAVELKPGSADIYNDLGLSMHYTGNSAEGVRYVEEGIKKDSLNQRIWLTKGFILAYGMGDLEGARTAWEKARALNPESQVGKAAAEFLAQSNKQ